MVVAVYVCLCLVMSFFVDEDNGFASAKCVALIKSFLLIIDTILKQ